MSLRAFLFPLLLAAHGASLPAAGPVFSSGPAQVSLIELYTSEGCSSCPPAEAWLSALREGPGLWKNYVPVAFHVSYWDHLGWTDRFASRAYTKRQYDYAAQWGSANVYTPCFVRDGDEWRPSGAAPAAPGGSAGTLSVAALGGDAYRVRFVPTAVESGRFDGHVALLGGGLQSKVTAGENGGTTLAHDFVVMSLAVAGLSATADRTGFEGTVHLVAPEAKNGPRLALATWVTRSGTLAPLQATGGWLRP